MSDAITTVTGLQGNPVSPAPPSHNDVLTWDEVDGYWVGRSKSLTKIYFSASGTWTPPKGVKTVTLIGSGGGGGGAGSGGPNSDNKGNPFSGGGGGGALPVSQVIEVDDTVTYDITIGAGGVGGNGTSGTNLGGNGGDGFPTALSNVSSLFWANGGGGAGGGPYYANLGQPGANCGGITPNGGGTPIYGDFRLIGSLIYCPAGGGSGGGGNGTLNAVPGFTQPTGGFPAGTNGLNNYGGGGGGAGSAGVGGNGGDVSVIGNGGAGHDAPANSGGGGGGGGGSTFSGATGGNGGAGGSGYLYIIY